MKKYLLILGISLFAWQCAVNVNSVEDQNPDPGPVETNKLNNGDICTNPTQCRSNSCREKGLIQQCFPSEYRECFTSALCATAGSPYSCFNNKTGLCFNNESTCNESSSCGNLDDLVASFRAQAEAVSEGDGDNSIIFTVRLNRPVDSSDDEVSFTYTISTPGGTGEADENDIGTITTLPDADDTGKIIIPVNSDSATITVPINNDEVMNEDEETFTITITPTGFNGNTSITATGTISSDTLELKSFAAKKAAAEGGSIEFTVELNRAVIESDDGVVSFRYSLTIDDSNDINTAGITTVPTADSNKKITIPANSDSATITVPIVLDSIGEAQETFAITIVDLSGFTAPLADRTATGTILADALALKSFANPAPATEGRNIVFTVQLNRAVTAADVTANDGNDVSFTYSPVYGSGDGKAEANDIGAITTVPLAVSGTTVTIGTGMDKATITVAIEDDEDNRGCE